MRCWVTVRVLVALVGVLYFSPGCASHAPQDTEMEESGSIERPAEDMGEEETTSDRLGEVGTALLVVGSVIGGIVLPLLLI